MPQWRKDELIIDHVWNQGLCSVVENTHILCRDSTDARRPRQRKQRFHKKKIPVWSKRLRMRINRSFWGQRILLCCTGVNTHICTLCNKSTDASRQRQIPRQQTLALLSQRIQRGKFLLQHCIIDAWWRINLHCIKSGHIKTHVFKDAFQWWGNPHLHFIHRDNY